MGTITDRQYFGATPKYHLEIEAGTLTMADYDFNVRLQRGPNAYEVNKNEMIEDQGDYYFILVSIHANAAGSGAFTGA